jgi:eukaryotic-like serine/threonine-protein kinase
MPLDPGTRLGPYEIVSPLGAGGMGEVYRARDTRLGREVAIKVLPQHLSATPELRARFEREARSVSQLNHPNICVLHDVGREGDTDFLVMELVDGETLEQRLARGPVPLAELLRVGSEVASALDRAHRAGIVHRDLKPGNIMLTKSGAKLMDFGLARAAGGAVSQSSRAGMTQSPTVAQALTGEGKIVGTFQYMSPEQLEGREADARSDLWALGSVLYEMATGRKPFSGTSTASLIGSIMKEEPRSLAELAPMSPPGLDRIVKRCLAKDPDDRWQSARDVAAELRYIAEAATSRIEAAPVVPGTAAAAGRPSRERMFWISTLVGVVVLAVALQVVRRPQAIPGSAGVTRFTVTTPEGIVELPDAADPSISPDGRALAFTATDSTGTLLIWLRSRDSLTPRPLPGTESASLPFWSPDSKYLGFFADGKLQKIRVDGGPAQILCDANNGRGATWSQAGTIVFAPAAEGPLYRVDAAGGSPTVVTALDSTRHETGHRWPCFLPDGKHFLYVVLPGDKDGNFETCVGSQDGGSPERLMTVGAAPIYADPGYLVFIRNGTLMVEPFDPGSRKVKGDPTALETLPLRTDYTGAREVTASRDGILAFRSPGSPNTDLVWYDRQGRSLGKVPINPGRFEGLTVSPDGTHIAVERRSAPTTADIWLVDVDRSVSTRFTFGPGESFTPVWSPDGQAIAYGCNRGGRENIYMRSVTGQGSEQLLYASNSLFKHTTQWSFDGQHVVFVELGENTGWDIFTLAPAPGAKAVPYLNSSFNESIGAISPDGRWMAYVSDESGRPEVYVDAFPTPGNKSQISTGGTLQVGQDLRWTRDGKSLIFETLDFAIMSVDLETTPNFRAGTPRLLFRVRPDVVSLSMTGDAQRFVATMPSGTTGSSITLVMNWAELLNR